MKVTLKPSWRTQEQSRNRIRNCPFAVESDILKNQQIGEAAMNFARITARGQTTIPKAVRNAARLKPGDVIAFEVAGDHLVVRKVQPTTDPYLRSIEGTFSEWSSAQDDEAWRDL